MAKIFIVSGSHRKKSQCGKVAKHIIRQVKLQGHQSFYLDLGNSSVPFWDEGVWEKSPKWKKVWDPIAKQITESDSLIIVTPEWHGMVPSALKNFFLLCSPAVTGHKPALIVSISAGINGAYPVAELRMSSYKNSKLVYIPDHMIIRNVEKTFNGSKPESEEDSYLRKRLDHSLLVLSEYAEALKSMRSKTKADHKSYPNGM